jgi:serine/threonine-protein kinase
MRTLTFNRIIGSGAMGTVYHAELKTPGGFVRPCACKVMKASGPDRDQFMSRMRDEARLLGMLQDEQVLGVAELVNVGDRDAVIMDYVEGIDLAELIKRHRVPARALCELGAEIAGTLHRAHKARHPSTGRPLNVIHRDIKPANIMVTPRGGIRLLDFGVARAAFADRESQTQGLVLGTLNYFPPEVLAGSEPTPAVDIYGLGLAMWECATGTNWGSPQAQQKRFESRVDERLAQIGSDYKDLEPVLRSILQWDPMLRPDGGVVERALLHAAGTAPGDPLRVWARDVVPQALAERDAEAKRIRDELVGKTFEVRAAHESDDDETDEAASRGYDDLAPPQRTPAPAPRATRGGAPMPRPAGVGGPLPPPRRATAEPPTPPAKRKPSSRGGRSALPWIVGLSVVLALGLLVAGVTLTVAAVILIALSG